MVSALLSAVLIAAPAPAADAPAPNDTSTSELSKARRSPLGLQVRSVTVDTGAETYRLSERSWSEVVYDNPALVVEQRRAQLFAPGVAGLSISGVWLTIAATATIDQFRLAEPEARRDILSAKAVTFRFVLPSALLISSAILTTIGGRARRRLDEARRAYYLGPQLSRGGAGLTVGGRF